MKSSRWLRRLFWVWALISVCWAVFVIVPSWSKKPREPWVWSEERGNTLPWSMVHHECTDRLAFWPDGSRMDDKDLSFWESIIIDTTPGLQLSDREQWAYDVRKKIADCEYAGWGPNAIQEQRRELLGIALLPPAILFLLGAVIAFAWKHYGETITRELLRVPRHIRRGLIRLYVAISVPWIACLATRLTPVRTEVRNLRSWPCQWCRSAH
jgi:hypothetical protein